MSNTFRSVAAVAVIAVLGILSPWYLSNALATGFGVESGSSVNSASTFPNAATFSSDIDLRGKLWNNGSGTCQGQSAGVVCLDDNTGFMMTGTGTSDTLTIWPNNAAGNSQIKLFNTSTTNTSTLSFSTGSPAAETVVAGFGFYNSAYSDADLQNLLAAYLIGGRAFSVIGDANGSAGTTLFSIKNNAAGSATTVVAVDAVGNIKLDSGATRTRGTITLAAGSGTATVASGAICSCVDTTANASVRCAVAATTLTATGTGTDVIAYICL